MPNIQTGARTIALRTLIFRDYEIPDEHASEVLTPHNRARVLSIELQRLDELHRIFHKHAVETQDPASGTLCVKIWQVITVLSGIAEFERDLILQRTNEGRARAMAEGTRSAASRS